MRYSTALASGSMLVGFGLALLVWSKTPELMLAGLASICLGAGALIAGIAGWRDR